MRRSACPPAQVLGTRLGMLSWQPAFLGLTLVRLLHVSAALMCGTVWDLISLSSSTRAATSMHKSSFLPFVPSFLILYFPFVKHFSINLPTSSIVTRLLTASTYYGAITRGRTALMRALQQGKAVSKLIYLLLLTFQHFPEFPRLWTSY